MSEPLWQELGSTMRRVRDDAGVSLRAIESRGSWRRSTISQVETAKARPSRDLVQWYDEELGTDGLLLSIYAEAQSRRALRTDTGVAGDDVVHAVDVDPPAGGLVTPNARLHARFTLVNGGARTWTGRRLRRMGAYTGLRLIGSAPSVTVPDLAPGERGEVTVALRAPSVSGTVIAYWSLVDDAGAEAAPSSAPLAVVLVVE